MRDISKFIVMDDLPSDCFDMLVASFSKWLRKEYRFLYAECLGLKIDPKGKSLGDVLQIDKGDILNFASKNGLAFQIHPMANMHKKELLRLLSQFNPLMAELDEYECRWRKNYQKLHRFHYILLHRFEETEDWFICTDTYPTQNNLALPVEFIMNHVRRVLCFWDNKKTAPAPVVHLCLQSVFEKYRTKDEIGTVKDRLEWVSDHLDRWRIANEVKGYEDVDLFYIPVIWKLKNIQWSYKQFSLFLSFIGQDTLEILQMYVSEILACWEIIVNAVSLNILRKSETLPVTTIQSNLRKVVYIEELMFEKLR